MASAGITPIDIEEAAKVAECLARAAEYNLQAEWLAMFVGGLRMGMSPPEAAEGACFECDC